MNKKMILSHSIVALIAALVVWFILPSKTEIKDLKKEISQLTEINEQNNSKVVALERTNSELRIKTSESYHMIKKPDGTIEVSKNSNSDTSKYESKYNELQVKYDTVVSENTKLRDTLKDYSKVETNKKAFVLGYSKSLLGYQSHNITAQADVFGRLGVIVNASFGTKGYSVAPGFAIRF